MHSRSSRACLFGAARPQWPAGQQGPGQEDAGGKPVEGAERIQRRAMIDAGMGLRVGLREIEPLEVVRRAGLERRHQQVDAFLVEIPLVREREIEAAGPAGSRLR